MLHYLFVRHVYTNVIIRISKYICIHVLLMNTRNLMITIYHIYFHYIFTRRMTCCRLLSSVLELAMFKYT